MYLLADSFGGLGQASLNEEAQRRAGLATSMGAFMQGQQMNRQSRQFQQQLAMEQQRASTEATYRQQEIEMRKAEIERQKTMDLQRNKIGEGYLDLGKQQLDWQKSQPTPQSLRQQDFDFQAASQDASVGMFDDDKHALALYPTLSPSQAKVMATRSTQARKQAEAQYSVAQDAADTLNRHTLLNRYIPLSQEAISSAHWYSNPNDVDKKSETDRMQGWQDELKEVAPKAQRIIQDKRLSGLITYSPEDDRYLPAIPAPPWLSEDGSTSTTGTAKPKGAAGAGTSTATSGYAPKYHPAVYSRVNDLISSGVPPIDAKRQALQEFQDATAAGSIP